MYKIINIGIPKYLTDIISKREIGDNIRNGNKSLLTAESKALKIHFPICYSGLVYSIDPTIINSKPLKVFKKLLAFIRPVQRSM